MPVRLAKFISDSGAASRRGAESLIESGAVSVNGAVVKTPVFFVDGSENIMVDGKRISGPARTRLFAFNKPPLVMTSMRDPDGRRTIYDMLPKELRGLKYVGRLDFNSSGLLLLTGDGMLARRLTLPSSGIPRVYVAKLHPKKFSEIKFARAAHALRRFLSPTFPDESIFDAPRSGISVGGVRYAPMDIDVLSRYPLSVRIVLREGKKNEIRIVMDSIGLPVAKLHRVSYGPIELGDLPSGGLRELSAEEVEMIRKSLSDGASRGS
jgi:23S rRNA pseudouridine2605 synthase